MKISDIVANKVNRFKAGYVFTYDDFNIPVKNMSALKMALNRLVSTGKIIRLSKGNFISLKLHNLDLYGLQNTR